MTPDKHAMAGAARIAPVAGKAPQRDGEGLRPIADSNLEIALHELGESLVASAVGMQRELRRYAEANGAFLLDDVEVDLPVKMRVDAFGQVMAELVSDVAANTAVARVRFRIRPDANPVERIPVVADQPLSALRVLSKEQIAFLESHRVFSVEDLVRATRNPACKRAVIAVIPEAVVDRALAVGGVLLIPIVPARVAEALVRAGVRSVEDFLGRDPALMADALSKILPETVPAEHLARWQSDLAGLRGRGRTSAADAPCAIARPSQPPVAGGDPIHERSRT